MIKNSRAPILLSMGDPAGIGPEITLKAWSALRENPEYAFAVIAPLSVLQDAKQSLFNAQHVPLVVVDHSNLDAVAPLFVNALPVIPIDLPSQNILGRPNSDNARAILHSIEFGVSKALDGKACGLVTNPISKDVLYRAGFKHAGHTEFLGALTQNDKAPYDSPDIRGPIMMLSGGGLRVALATVHIPLKTVAHTLTKDQIIKSVRVMHAALKTDFGIPNPRIAIAGLNPHAGENGALGREDIEVINPAAKALQDMGITVTNAQPADTLFHSEARQGYDAVLAMYHDQGLIPVKTLDFHGGVNITLGLPIIRTSPDHGTAFNIAGQNKARPDSLIAAIKTARNLADHRQSYRNKHHA